MESRSLDEPQLKRSGYKTESRTHLEETQLKRSGCKLESRPLQEVQFKK